mmetsp:Transcript_1434/g.2972  ORF Transcript_1434/g.2972 Transcript_1434/m.2972 type:complete len:201 (-) Transcript_1434:823-1425(-)
MNSVPIQAASACLAGPKADGLIIPQRSPCNFWTQLHNTHFGVGASLPNPALGFSGLNVVVIVFHLHHHTHACEPKERPETVFGTILALQVGCIVTLNHAVSNFSIKPSSVGLLDHRLVQIHLHPLQHLLNREPNSLSSLEVRDIVSPHSHDGFGAREVKSLLLEQYGSNMIHREHRRVNTVQHEGLFRFAYAGSRSVLAD